MYATHQRKAEQFLTGPQADAILTMQLQRLTGLEIEKLAKEYGDLSYKEIAKTLKIKLGTVMSRLNRARQAIKEQIKGEKNV